MLRQAVADPEEGHGAMALSGAPARVTFWFSRSSFAQNIFSPKGHRTLKKVNFRDFFKGFSWLIGAPNPIGPSLEQILDPPLAAGTLLCLFSQSLFH